LLVTLVNLKDLMDASTSHPAPPPWVNTLALQIFVFDKTSLASANSAFLIVYLRGKHAAAVTVPDT